MQCNSKKKTYLGNNWSILVISNYCSHSPVYTATDVACDDLLRCYMCCVKYYVPSYIYHSINMCYEHMRRGWGSGVDRAK